MRKSWSEKAWESFRDFSSKIEHLVVKKKKRDLKPCEFLFQEWQMLTLRQVLECFWDYFLSWKCPLRDSQYGRRWWVSCGFLLRPKNLIVSVDGSPITQPQQIEILQDTSQSSLEQYIRTQYSSQPTRFGKLLLMLSSLRKVEPAVIEQLFFAEVLRGASMGDVLKKMLTSNSSAPIVHGSLMA